MINIQRIKPVHFLNVALGHVRVNGRGALKRRRRQYEHVMPASMQFMRNPPDNLLGPSPVNRRE
jgi:hypothetical protein